MSIEEKTFRAVGYTLITGFAILCLIPFLIIIASSFSSESYIIQHGYGLIPGDFTLESYASIFKNPASVFRAYGVTTVVTVVGTIGGIFINTMTGYVLQRKDFPWRNKFSFYFFLHNIVQRWLDPWYILMYQISEAWKFFTGTDSADYGFCVEYFTGKRVYGGNSI